MLSAKEIKVNDVVEFLSDRQTEKGPSCGRCISRDDERVIIKHSDSIETFVLDDLEVSHCSNKWEPGWAYWAFK